MSGLLVGHLICKANATKNIFRSYRQFHNTRVLNNNILASNLHLLQPGLIHISNGLTADEQKEISLQSHKIGIEKNGFLTNSDNSNKLNSTDYRGRMYNSIDNFPLSFRNILLNKYSMLKTIDSSLPLLEPTHLILLYYKTLTTPPTNGYIPWHQDNGENDGNDNYSVISFNIGDHCDFLVAPTKPKISQNNPLSNPSNLAHRIHLSSGDILVFGGPSRFIWHSIYNIHPNTAPAFFPFDGGRLNLTFRYTPTLFGKENHFQTITQETLSADNQFYKLSKMK